MVYLKKVTRNDVINLISTYIQTSSPSRAKLSTHLRSTAQSDDTPRFDPESAGPLVSAFTTHGLAVDPTQIQELMSSNPFLSDVKSFAIGAIDNATVDEAGRTELRAAVDQLKAKDKPVTNGDEVTLRDVNVVIDDIHKFKAGLIPSRAPIPLEPLVVGSAKL